MLKALLKKQFLESVSFILNGKNGKRRSAGAAVAFGALMLYAFGAVGFMFWEIADMLLPLAQNGMAWLYFAFMGTVATGFGIVGGIFTAKAKLYEAKDNDLLLSMPVPAWAVLFSRTAGLYLFTLLFEGLAFVPAIARYFTAAGFSFSPFICALTAFLFMPLGALSVCCILGWLIALVSAKFPVKNLIAVIFSVAFLAAYFAVYSKLNEYLGYVIAHGEAVGGVMKTTLYPFAKLGAACTGEGASLLTYIFMFAGVFALVYLALSATYFRLATANKGSIKAKYTGKGYKGRSVFSALLQKEAFRYFKNPMVAMNCFLGSVFFVILPFIALFNVSFFRQLVSGDGLGALILAAILCAIGSMNLVSSTSVSLEGDSLDVFRVMPVKTEKILFAKAAFHFLSAGAPALFGTVFLCLLIGFNAALSVTVALTVLFFVALCAAGGLTINLKLPNMRWTNEVAVVKQSVSSLAATFAGWGAIALFVGGYFLFGKYLPAWGYLLVCSTALALACGALAFWIKKKGVKIFEGL